MGREAGAKVPASHSVRPSRVTIAIAAANFWSRLKPGVAVQNPTTASTSRTIWRNSAMAGRLLVSAQEMPKDCFS